MLEPFFEVIESKQVPFERRIQVPVTQCVFVFLVWNIQMSSVYEDSPSFSALLSLSGVKLNV